MPPLNENFQTGGGGGVRFTFNKFIHTYDPQSVEFNDVVKVLDELAPVFADVWVEIV